MWRFLCRCGGMALAPALEPPPDIPRLQPQDRANGDERKRPAGIIAEQPLLRLARQALDAPSLTDQSFVETQERIFQDCPHQLRLRLPVGEMNERVVDLFRQHADIAEQLLCGVPIICYSQGGCCR